MGETTSKPYREVHNFPGGVDIRGGGVNSSANADTGGNYETAGRTTNVTKGNDVRTHQGGTFETYKGDVDKSVSGGNNITCGHFWEIVGGSKIWRSGAAAEANSTNASITATQAAKSDDGSLNMNMASRLSNIAASITNATASIDADKVQMPEPSGNIQVDLLALVEYQRKMLMEYSVKSALKRALLAIKHEVEKMKKQAEETQKMWKRMGKAITDLNLMDVKEMATAPSDEEKQSNQVITKDQATRSQLGDKDASRTRKRNNGVSQL